MNDMRMNILYECQGYDGGENLDYGILVYNAI
jgi:hypothetical protein